MDEQIRNIAGWEISQATKVAGGIVIRFIYGTPDQLRRHEGEETPMLGWTAQQLDRFLAELAVHRGEQSSPDRGGAPTRQ